MTNKTRDMLCSVIMLAFGAAMIYFAQGIKHKIASDVGSAYVPTFIGICILAAAGSKLFIALFRPSASSNKKIKIDQDMLGGLGTIALMLGYMLVFQPVGFVVSSAAYLFLQMLLLSNRENCRPLLYAIIAVLLPVAVDALFVFVINMPLPVGVWGF